MLTILIWLIFIAVAMAIVWWILSQIPVPPPMRLIINVVFGLVCLIVLFWLFGSVVGAPPHLGAVRD
jgi:hypothetical protein